MDGTDDKPTASTVQEPQSVPLGRAIEAWGKETKRLTLRPPNGGDIAACGMPYLYNLEEISGEPYVKINGPGMRKMIARLAEIPASSVDTLSAPDMAACIAKVIGFFTDGEATPKTDSSTR